MSGITRGPQYGGNGMVATSQTAATQCGLAILRAGGSAIDAAIAANAALAVIEPHMCGPGGDLFAMVWDPNEQGLIGLNASGRSARNLTFEGMVERVDRGAHIPVHGPLPITTPAAVDGWCMLHDNYGRLSLAEVLAPAIELARSGIRIGLRTAAAWAEATQHLQSDPALEGLLEPFSKTFTTGGETPAAGQIFRNTDLAETYLALGRSGSAGLYEGNLAERMLEYLQSLGSPLGMDDLQAPQANWVKPLSTSYRGYEIFELPPNGQGMTVLQMLNILEGFELSALDAGSSDYWHLFLEAKKLAFEDRAQFYADPDTYNAPIEPLLSKRYADERRRLIDRDRAGDGYTHGAVTIPGSDTTYLCAADRDGMMVSLIQSIFSPFGSGLVPPGLGFAFQCRGAGFSLDAGHPNCYQPGKRPFHTIIPGFVCRHGKPWLSFGVMGADMQPQGQVEVLTNMIDFGLDPQAAGDAPRLRHDGGAQPNGSHLGGIGITQYEAGIDQAVVSELSRRGHHMVAQKRGVAGFTGGYQGILYDDTHGVYVGASESRLDGAALGY